MALKTTRDLPKSILLLNEPESGFYKVNHIFEPEYHQPIYADICETLENTQGAFQIGSHEELQKYPHRGTQPKYADDEDDPDSLRYIGQLLNDGTYQEDNPGVNICALKSISIRQGYVDFETARSTSKEFYNTKKAKAGIIKNDILINSTGDGTIGRVAIYNEDFPALVDGHITIIRFSNVELAWYIGAYLLSDEGQRQIYRYINGSSGQVEIYPQDIARIWVRKPPKETIGRIANSFQEANDQFRNFRESMRKSLSF